MEAFWVAFWGANTPSDFADQLHAYKSLRNSSLEAKPESGGEFKVLRPELLGASLSPACLCSKTDKLVVRGRNDQPNFFL